MENTAETGKTQYYKRKHYFINKRLQGKVILYFILIGVVIALATDTVIWHYSNKEIAKYLYRSHIKAVGPWDVMVPIIVKTITAFSIILIVTAIFVIGILSKYVSSRLSGITTALNRFGEGDLAVPVDTKDIDGLRDQLESARLVMCKRLKALNDIQKDMAAAAEKLKNPASAQGVRQELGGLSKTFQKKLAEFKYNKNQGER
ncbi:MAG: hypothetical protein HY806_08280 [Nitrospirae bacterium]|nr:hypothetical protein [Nitrospirota bacterium]